MTIAIEHAQAERGLLIVMEHGSPRIVAAATSTYAGTAVALHGNAVDSAQLAKSVMNHVLLTRQNAVLDDGAIISQFSDDEYLRRHSPKSVLCLPILKEGDCIGTLYLENRLVPQAFSGSRIALLELLASQAAVSLENAQLKADLEEENRNRKRAEDDLQRSQASFALAQRLSRTSSCWWQVSTGQIAWSEESYRLLGYPFDTAPTLESILRRCHPDDLERLQTVLGRAAQSGKDFELQHRLLLPDGSIKHVRVTAHCLSSAPGDLEFVAAISDVTEHRLTQNGLEEALAQISRSEARLQAIIAAIPAMAWGARADGHVEFFSQRWLEYTGLPMAEAQGNGWAITIHPDDAGVLSRLWQESLVSGKTPPEVEARLRRFDGAYRWFLFRSEPLLDAQGNVTNWYGVCTDIEDRKRADDSLRRSKAYMEHAQELSHTGSVGFRVSDGRVMWSEEAARIYGYDPEVPPTMDMVLRRVHPDDLEHMQEVFARAAQGACFFDFEHRLLMPDGSIKRIRNLARSVVDDTGRGEVLGAITDITEQYRNKANLERALDEIRKSEDRLRTTIETIPALTWSALEDGSADYFSQAWLRHTGLSFAQALGAGWATAIHPDDRSVILDQWLRIIESKEQGEAEARFRRSDGEYRWFLFRTAPLLDANGNVLRWYGTNTDIDDLKRAETLLAGEKQLFEMMAIGQPLRLTLEAVCRLVETLTNGLRACILLSELQDEPLWAGPNAVAVQDVLRKQWSVPLLSSRQTVLGSLAVYASQPSRPIDPLERGVVERCAHLASIVVERKRVAEALEKSEAFLAEGQRISHTGSFKWNVQSGEITWSDETFRIFEFEPSSQLAFDTILHRIHPDDRAAAKGLARQVELRGQEAECRLLMPDGSVKHIYVVTQNATGDEACVEVIGALMDVTASRTIQARLQHSLGEKDALLKEVHHRVKNNLQLISSLLSLQASATADPAVAELFAESRNRVRSMALVHENLYRAGDLSRVQMRDHVETLRTHLSRAYAMASGRIVLQANVDDLELDLDRAISVGLIINELVSNALKHAFPDDRQGEVLIALKVVGSGQCRLSVKDNGIGLRKGFDNDRAESLGLRLVQNLALQLHGRTEVSVDEGTVIAIVFDAGNVPEVVR